MGAVNWERWARAGGIGFVVFAVAAFVVGGQPPKIGDPAGEVVAYFWSPTGEYLFILIPLALLWILVPSIVLVRSAPASATAVESPVPAST
jgi:hypothetical protein